jgi:tetratricopeptide (TPR) repeat protein
MNLQGIEFDARGCRLTGATPAALIAYERALALYRSWRSGVDVPLGEALNEAPGFAMARALQMWLIVGSRDRDIVQAARPLLGQARALPAGDSERMHLAAIEATLDDDYERAKSVLGEALSLQPRDALALQVAHAFDYLTGDTARLGDRVSAVLPAWSSDLPGYHAVLAMHAFSLEECGEYGRAEQAAGAALALNPADARAHHVMAHVFEMTERADAGARWLDDHVADWSVGTVVATHCWWHRALFDLARGRHDQALSVYDAKIRGTHSGAIADLIDAAALLWRIEMYGGGPGKRWVELAAAWGARIDDRFCSFSDLHAMLAFVGARRWDLARRLERTLTIARLQPTRYGETTRQVGLPACQALLAFRRGDDAKATTLLARLPAKAHRLGGSHAQRNVLQLTMRRATQRLRRPPGWRRFVPPSLVARARA